MHSITIQDFQAIVGNEDVVVLDIRDKAAIAEFSLPNTVAMPTTSLPNRLNELNAETHMYLAIQVVVQRLLLNFYVTMVSKQHTLSVALKLSKKLHRVNNTKRGPAKYRRTSFFILHLSFQFLHTIVNVLDTIERYC